MDPAPEERHIPQHELQRHIGELENITLEIFPSGDHHVDLDIKGRRVRVPVTKTKTSSIIVVTRESIRRAIGRVFIYPKNTDA